MVKGVPVEYPFRVTAFCSACDYSWDSSFVFYGESHDFWDFVCVSDGEVEVVEDDKVYTLRAGDFVCHAPMEFHRIRSAGGTHPHVWVMTFRHEGALPAKLQEGVFRLSAAEMEEYRGLFYRIFRYIHSEEQEAYYGAEAAFAAASFLTRLSWRTTPQERISGERGAAEYRRLIGTMQTCVRENLTLPEIAEKNAVSVSTMKNLFRTYAGISPKAYYARLRGLEARNLLESGMEIREVAEKMNFSSPNYLNLFFKNQFGMPPGKYKHKQE